MSGLKSCLAAIALLGLLGSSAPAQGTVPGGWAVQFSYQSLNNGTGGGAGFYAPPPPGWPPGPGDPSYPNWGYPPYGYGPYPTTYGISPPIAPPPAFVRPPTGTINATGGLIRGIQRSTRRPGR